MMLYYAFFPSILMYVTTIDDLVLMSISTLLTIFVITKIKIILACPGMI